MHQRTMNCKVAERIERVHQAQRHEIMDLWLHSTYLWIGFSSEAARLLVREQGLDSHERLRELTDKSVDDICNVVRKPGSKNTSRMPDRWWQVSVIAKENLKLDVFLFHHW